MSNVRKRCLIKSYDYLDLDVFWNAKFFYQSCGFDVCRDQSHGQVDLIVILRGIPSSVDRSYNGTIHVYDYVAELLSDCREYFPNASRIYLISLTQPRFLSPETAYVRGYLPVVPEIWQHADKIPKTINCVHISNFKVIGKDSYQQEIVTLALQGNVLVYGSGWSCNGIETGRISHWQANQILFKSICCYGLMYPHQRGKTLSGRMWQAPLSGCFVISEHGTNIDDVPGVIEVESYLNNDISILDLKHQCNQLRQEAASFWRAQTENLAIGLNLIASSRSHPFQVLSCKTDIFRRHMLFVYEKQFTRLTSYWQIFLNVLRRSLRGGRRR